MAPVIRLATPADAASIAEIYRPSVESTPITFETDAPDAAEMRRRLDEVLDFYPWLVCQADGRVVGYAYASTHRARAAYRWSVDTAVYVGEDVQRRGVGRALYTSLFAILRAQRLFNAYAGITLPNPGSVALHESLGFRPVGVYPKVGYKLGAWRDVGWWQLALQAHQPSPPVPISVSEVRAQPSWPALLETGLPHIRRGGM